MTLLELAEQYRADILALDDARRSAIYGGLSPYAIFGPTHVALKRAGLVRSTIPAGCMGPITKLTPKGCKLAAALRTRHAIAQARGETL